MNIDPVSLSAFRNEMEKIAFLRQGFRSAVRAVRGAGGQAAASNGARAAEAAREASFVRRMARRPGESVPAHWLRKGWNEVGGPHGARGGWFGAEDTWRSKLPIGGKTLTVGFTGLALPNAVRKEDPAGLGRSRAERLSQLGASTVGGLMGVGALMRDGKIGLGKSLIGGIGGSMAGEYAASLPFRKARQQRIQGGPLSREDRAQLMSQVRE